MTEEILKRIDALAAKLGVAASKLFEIYTKQALIEARVDLFWAIVFAVVFASIVALVIWAVKSDRLGEDWTAGLIMTGFIAGFASLGIAAVYGSVAVKEYYNPQFWAIQHITEDLKR